MLLRIRDPIVIKVSMQGTVSKTLLLRRFHKIDEKIDEEAER